MSDRMERAIDRAIWVAIGMVAAALLLLLVAEASGDDESLLVDPPQHTGEPTAVASMADLVVELVRRIDAADAALAEAVAAHEDEVAGLRLRIEIGDEAASVWAFRFAECESRRGSGGGE